MDKQARCPKLSPLCNRLQGSSRRPLLVSVKANCFLRPVLTFNTTEHNSRPAQAGFARSVGLASFSGKGAVVPRRSGPVVGWGQGVLCLWGDGEMSTQTFENVRSQIHKSPLEAGCFVLWFPQPRVLGKLTGEHSVVIVVGETQQLREFLAFQENRPWETEVKIDSLKTLRLGQLLTQIFTPGHPKVPRRVT